MDYIFLKDYIQISIDSLNIGKIDFKSYDLVKQYDWFIHQGYFYTRLKNPDRLVSMHALIFGPLSNNNYVIDHINRDRLDNRKQNLRETSRSINSTNAKIRSDKKQDLPRGIVYRPENKEKRNDGKGQKRYESFEVQWSLNGKRHTKTFSVKKFGSYDTALKEAINFRNKKLEEMKIQSNLIEI